ncbi:MAG: purine-binding chemotaxis protein CheW [Deltaproteobacteria bacterium]|nr:purine-binding chemotaxis protein CheW [Deltaproteobacteria bacterium]
MDDLTRLVVFTLEGHRFALPLGNVQRVFRLVEVTPLPKAPEVVLGVVNIRGRIIPVVDIRKRFRLPERRSELSDHLIISDTSRRPVGIIAESVEGISECPEKEVVSPGEIIPGIEYVEGVARLKDGIVLIHDIEKFLSLEEEEILDQALARKTRENE